MDKLQAIQFVIKNAHPHNEWEEAEMWKLVKRIAMGVTELNEKELMAFIEAVESGDN